MSSQRGPTGPTEEQRTDFFLDKEMNVVYMSKNFRAFPGFLSQWVSARRVLRNAPEFLAGNG
jgi:hypothetical protein